MAARSPSARGCRGRYRCRARLDQLQAPSRQPEDAALGDVEHGLAALARVAAAEGAVLDLAHELARRALAARCADGRPRPPPQRARRERADEDHALAFWLMLMKPPAPGQPRTEARDVEVALPVGLGEAEEREVEPAAVVEVELVGLVDDRLRR